MKTVAGLLLSIITTTLMSSAVVAQPANASSPGMSGAQGAGGMGGGHAPSGKGGGGHGSEQMHQSMMSGMQKMQSMTPTGDADEDFASMMRMHHQQAVEMARLEVQHGKSSELKAMARKIIKDQQKEISQLDRWLAKNK
ncbi:DUF305 domain-containing protein [Piscinibacter koreensis]|uniref:DUF305 domain-containing protein n=1 Tax=Piscinibacter koreensis TaxID=2742824 RepID=A0A7Y6NSC1_9BURK|nr:DUF305 domain-containing protein [Schlegelella koreensis]NUZ08429.1 DUF305 domain-containing protein [Schlegelella koreensis]